MTELDNTQTSMTSLPRWSVAEAGLPVDDLQDTLDHMKLTETLKTDLSESVDKFKLSSACKENSLSRSSPRIANQLVALAAMSILSAGASAEAEPMFMNNEGFGKQFPGTSYKRSPKSFSPGAGSKKNVTFTKKKKAAKISAKSKSNNRK